MPPANILWDTDTLGDYNYDRTTEEDRLSEFIKAVDLLTISQEKRLKLQIHQMKAEHSAE
jgi:hypothetical protein